MMLNITNNMNKRTELCRVCGHLKINHPPMKSVFVCDECYKQDSVEGRRVVLGLQDLIACGRYCTEKDFMCIEQLIWENREDLDKEENES